MVLFFRFQVLEGGTFCGEIRCIPSSIEFITSETVSMSERWKSVAFENGSKIETNSQQWIFQHEFEGFLNSFIS
jgi:hypothetical protein